MGWIGLRDGARARVDPALDAGALLATGTIRMEFAVQPGLQGQVLLSYFADQPWPSGLSVALDARGALRLTQRQGATRRTYELQTNLAGRASGVVLTFTWNAPARAAFLSAQISETAQTVARVCEAPLPVAGRDVQRMVADPHLARVAEGLSYLAISDQTMPHGPMPTLEPDARVETPEGPVRIDRLRPGDKVLAAGGGHAHVRWQTTQTLIPCGQQAPVRLRAPHHGARRDLLAAGDARLLMTGSAVEYLFDTEHVVSRLRDVPEAVVAPDGSVTRRFAQVVLDRPAAMIVGGVGVLALDVSDLIAQPALRAHSVLADMPAELMPRSAQVRAPLLRDFETRSLCHLRAA